MTSRQVPTEGSRGESLTRSAKLPRGYRDGGCEVCGSQWIHRLSINALFYVGQKQLRWPKRRQAMQSCFECGHRQMVMQAVSRDVLEFSI